MKSNKHGTNISPEITNISSHGFWLFWEGRELFLDFTHFPWFRDAKISEISSVEVLSATHFYWPSLDVDLSLESVINPEKYPLKSNPA